MGPLFAFVVLSALPEGFVEATGFLLGHGMGDPRRGEYREATVDPLGFWVPVSGTATIHGWALPAEGGKPPRIVDRFGVVQNALSIGKPADLEKDVEADVKGVRSGDGSEARLTMAAVLFAGGRRDLAERLISVASNAGNVKAGLLISFLGRRYRQATSAFIVGQDAEALRLTGEILSEEGAFRKEIGAPIYAAPLAFLRNLPLLRDDVARRLAHPRPPLDLSSLRRLAPLEEARALIERLDELSAPQRSFPGRIDFAGSPVVGRLIELGDVAVEPLLDCVDSDGRLTRSMSFRSPDRPHRRVEPVRNAAYAALFEIVGVPLVDPSGRRIDLRAYWNGVKAKPAVERWFDLLADDAAGPDRWREAASRLFAVDRPSRWGAPAQPIDLRPAPTATEALRARKNPSLADLLSRRARSLIAPKSPTRDDGGFRAALSLRLALLDARWEGHRALPLLREAMRGTFRKIEPGAAVARFDDVRELTSVIEMRAALGDGEVWPEYRRWIPRQTIDADAATILAPLARHPDAPGLRELARHVYLSPASRYNLVRLFSLEPSRERAISLIYGGLSLSPVKEAVTKLLGDKTVVGESGVGADGKAFVPNGAYPRLVMDADRDARLPFRLCDRLATSLSALVGAPKFCPYWTLEDRDRALIQMRRFVGSYRRPPTP